MWYQTGRLWTVKYVNFMSHFPAQLLEYIRVVASVTHSACKNLFCKRLSIFLKICFTDNLSKQFLQNGWYFLFSSQNCYSRLSCVQGNYLEKHNEKWKSHVAIESTEALNQIDPYRCTIQTKSGESVVTVGHIPREISRHCYFFLKEEGGEINVNVFSTTYRPSPISLCGLEIPLVCNFKVQSM